MNLAGPLVEISAFSAQRSFIALQGEIIPLMTCQVLRLQDSKEIILCSVIIESTNSLKNVYNDSC